MLQRFKSVFQDLQLQEKLLLALVFCLPFERVPSLEVHGFTIKLSFVFGTLLAIAVIPLSFNKRRFLQRTASPALLLPVLLLLYSGLSIVWSHNLSYWLRANLVLGFCILIFYAAYMIILTSKKMSRLLLLIARVVLVSAVVVLLFGLWQWLGDLLNLSNVLTTIRPEYDADRLGLPRIHSTFLEPMWMGCFLLLPLSIVLADTKHLVTKSVFVRLGFVIGILSCITLSLSRGALLVAAVITLLGVVYNIKSGVRITPSRRQILLGTAAFVIFGLFTVTAIGRFSKKGDDPNNNYGRGFSTITSHLSRLNIFERQSGTQRTSLSDRTIGRQSGITTLTASPFIAVFGTGAGQYGTYTTPDSGAEATTWFTLLDFWLSYGLLVLLGFISFICIVISKLIQATRTKSSSSIIKLLAATSLLYFLGFWLQSFSTGSFTITHLWVWLGIAAGLSSLKPGSVSRK